MTYDNYNNNDEQQYCESLSLAALAKKLHK